MSEEEAPVVQQHAEQWNAILGQGTETSPFQEPQEHWSCQEAEEPEAHALTSILTPTSSKWDSTNRYTQTIGNREGDSQPSTSMEQMKTPKGDGFAASETTSDWKPLSLETSEAENEDISDDDWIKNGGSKSNFKTLKSKKRTRQRPKKTNVSYKNREPGELLNLKSFSEGRSPFFCKVCGESFPGRSYLMKHVRVHPKDMVSLHPDKHVISVENVIKHLQTHREENLCEICGKTFTQKSHLKRHMWVHTGQKPHCCKDCGKRFGRSESLRIHRRVHTAERPYVCGVCGKGFNQKCNLDTHMRSHTGEKPYGCGVCSNAFAHKKDMIRHMKTHIEIHHCD